MSKRRYGAINHWGRAFFMIVSDSDRLNGELITLPTAKPTSVTVCLLRESPLRSQCSAMSALAQCVLKPYLNCAGFICQCNHQPATKHDALRTSFNPASRGFLTFLAQMNTPACRC